MAANLSLCVRCRSLRCVLILVRRKSWWKIFSASNRSTSTDCCSESLTLTVNNQHGGFRLPTETQFLSNADLCDPRLVRASRPCSVTTRQDLFFDVKFPHLSMEHWKPEIDPEGQNWDVHCKLR